MVTKLHPDFIVDSFNKKKAVILPIEEWKLTHFWRRAKRYLSETLEIKHKPMTNDDPVLETFISTLKKNLGENLREVWLFGSHARGDYHEHSDYDVIVVAEGQLKNIRTIVEDADYLILDTYNELIGSIVYTPAIWNQSKHGPLGMNVMAQGRRIA